MIFPDFSTYGRVIIDIQALEVKHSKLPVSKLFELPPMPMRKPIIVVFTDGLRRDGEYVNEVV